MNKGGEDSEQAARPKGPIWLDTPEHIEHRAELRRLIQEQHESTKRLTKHLLRLEESLQRRMRNAR